MRQLKTYTHCCNGILTRTKYLVGGGEPVCILWIWRGDAFEEVDRDKLSAALRAGWREVFRRLTDA